MELWELGEISKASARSAYMNRPETAEERKRRKSKSRQAFGTTAGIVGAGSIPVVAGSHSIDSHTYGKRTQNWEPRDWEAKYDYRKYKRYEPRMESTPGQWRTTRGRGRYEWRETPGGWQPPPGADEKARRRGEGVRARTQSRHKGEQDAAKEWLKSHGWREGGTTRERVYVPGEERRYWEPGAKRVRYNIDEDLADSAAARQRSKDAFRSDFKAWNKGYSKYRNTVLRPRRAAIAGGVALAAGGLAALGANNSWKKRNRLIRQQSWKRKNKGVK